MDNNRALESKMKEHGVRPTAVRNLILSALEASDNPVSSLDIETRLDTVDRSSITRALALFVEKGLIHLIDDGSGAAKYEVCRNPHAHDHALDHVSEDLHVHFRCTRCGKTFCLPSHPIPPVTLPEGFTPQTANFIITGVCPACGRISESKI